MTLLMPEEVFAAAQTMLDTEAVKSDAFTQKRTG
jgi:hypothetical protein